MASGRLSSPICRRSVDRGLLGRRDFVRLVGAAAGWPLAAHAQEAERMRLIGFLTEFAEGDTDSQARVRVFRQTLEKLGWTNGRNIRVDYRWAGGDAERLRAFAQELVGEAPDAIIGQGTPSVRALQQATGTIPIIFVQVTDPVRAGFVASMAKPGGNITGLSMYEPEMGSKWIQLLKEIAPEVARAGLLFNPDTAPGHGLFFLPAIKAAATPLAVEPVLIPVHNAVEIEQELDIFTRGMNEGLFVMPDVSMQLNRAQIIAAAARYRLPAIYSQRTFVDGGGLISYGIDTVHQFREAAVYVDHILRGDTPSGLPVQGPVKFELVINVRTAKTLGLDLSVSLLARADDLIE